MTKKKRYIITSIIVIIIVAIIAAVFFVKNNQGNKIPTNGIRQDIAGNYEIDNFIDMQDPGIVSIHIGVGGNFVATAYDPHNEQFTTYEGQIIKRDNFYIAKNENGENLFSLTYQDNMLFNQDNNQIYQPAENAEYSTHDEDNQ